MRTLEQQRVIDALCELRQLMEPDHDWRQFQWRARLEDAGKATLSSLDFVKNIVVLHTLADWVVAMSEMLAKEKGLITPLNTPNFFKLIQWARDHRATPEYRTWVQTK